MSNPIRASLAGSRRTSLAVATTVIAVLLSLPTIASAANGFGLKYLGQSECLRCHGRTTGTWQVGTYLSSGHGRHVTNVEASGGLEPAASSTSLWPSPLFGTGTLRFAPADIRYMYGSPGRGHRFISKFKNDAASRPLSTGSNLTSVTSGPTDDLLYFSARWSNGAWVATAGSRGALMQDCGPCHNTGVSRPLNTTYTLANGTVVGRSTETSWADLGIGCEACHATGRVEAVNAPLNHADKGVAIVRARRALNSDTCGQCHNKDGTPREDTWSKKTPANPNGYTPDRDLSDFMGAIAGEHFVRGDVTSPTVVIPEDDAEFYPNGNSKMGHHGDDKYNEWLITPHAQSNRNRKTGEIMVASSHYKDSCLSCHSGEGFLQKIGYSLTQEESETIGMPYQSSLASDTLNVECGICHTVHAQTATPLGLRFEGNELCGKCHYASAIPHGGTITAGSTARHGAIEMVEGYGFIGISAMGPFMGNATCPDCHMPEGSHSFNVMLPGDAEDWGVGEGGDSCTPCHASRTRAMLQADLDGWAADVSAATTAAIDAQTAAISRPASVTAAGIALLNAVKSNLTINTMDKSRGAHNYPYAMAGLAKTREFAQAVGAAFSGVGVTAYNTPAGYAVMYGTLKDGEGTALAGKTIAIQRRARGSATWLDYTSAMTSANGAFGLAVQPVTSHAGPGSTEFRAVWNPGITEASVYSPTVISTIGSSTTIRTSRTSLPLGYSALLSGVVTPNHYGRVVTIQYKRGTGAWTTLTRRTLGTTSAYSYYYRPRYRGTYYFRTVFPTDTSHAGSTSSAVAVRVY